MANVIKVGMADLAIAKHPDALTTLGLGSCVGIALYDTGNNIAGLAHIMLPSSEQIKNNSNRAKFADTGIEDLIDKLVRNGASKSKLVAKIAGGSQMFSFGNTNDIMRIGERNVVATKEKLKKLGIPVISEDTGGNHGRTIEVYANDGRLLVKTIGYGVKYI